MMTRFTRPLTLKEKAVLEPVEWPVLHTLLMWIHKDKIDDLSVDLDMDVLELSDNLIRFKLHEHIEIDEHVYLYVVHEYTVSPSLFDEKSTHFLSFEDNLEEIDAHTSHGIAMNEVDYHNVVKQIEDGFFEEEEYRKARHKPRT